MNNINKLLAKIAFDVSELGFFLYQLDIVENKKIQTCAVSSTELMYNPDFLNSLTETQALGVLLHEVVHSMFMHPSEMDASLSSNKIKELWEIALEMVTNAETLKLIKCFSLSYELPGVPFSPLNPNSKLSTKTIYYYDKTFENEDSITIYYKLCEMYNSKTSQVIGQKHNNETKNGNKDENLINIDKIIPEKMKDPPNVLKLQEMANAIKKRGNTANNLERLINELTKCHIPWERILYNYVNEVIGSENYSYNSRNFRHPFAEEIIIPGLSDNLIDVIVAVDTSGSISCDELTKFTNGIKGLYTYTDRIKIVSVDADVQNEQELSITELQNIKFKGGGGTDFNNFFKKYSGRGLIIFFTDGYASYPEKPVRDVLWVLTKDHQKPPFGKIVFIEE